MQHACEVVSLHSEGALGLGLELAATDAGKLASLPCWVVSFCQALWGRGSPVVRAACAGITLSAHAAGDSLCEL